MTTKASLTYFTPRKVRTAEHCSGEFNCEQFKTAEEILHAKICLSNDMESLPLQGQLHHTGKILSTVMPGLAGVFHSVFLLR